MKQISYYILIPASILLASLIYGLNNNIIIFRSPFTKTVYETVGQNRTITKKTVTLWYWHNERWNKEDTDIIWDQDIAKTVHHMLNSLLNVLDEENVTHQRIAVQSVALTVSGNEALISFDQSPFNQERSTIHKVMFIEALLKTFRENSIKLQGIYFLVHHKPLEDVHLDFSRPWPLSGYMIA